MIEVADWRRTPSDRDRQLRALGMWQGPWFQPPTAEAVLVRDDLLVMGSRPAVEGYVTARASAGVLADPDPAAMLAEVEASADVWFLTVVPEIVRQQASQEREPAFAAMRSAWGWLRLGGGERNVRGVLTGSFEDPAGAVAMREQVLRGLESLRKRLQDGTTNIPDDPESAGAGSILLAALRSAQVEASEALLRIRVRDRRGR